MKREISSDKFIKRFFVTAVVLLLLCAITVIVFDPFFHYHKPLFSLKAVLNEKEYQVPGTLDHFDYNAVIAGSSVAENYNNAWFDNNFDCHSIKAIRSYGATADLCYFIERANEKQYLKYVFFNLDPSSIIAEPITTFKQTGSPMYLYDHNIFTDVNYLFNKDVICERIPYMVATSFLSDYDEGTSYNWGQWKTFSEESALSHYYRNPVVSTEEKPANEYLDSAKANIKYITDLAQKHPQSDFIVFIPPYSILWWDTINRDGDVQAYIAAEEYALKTLNQYKNIRIFNFQNADDIVYNLNVYLDSLHFSPDINRYICDCLKDGRYELKDDSMIESSLKSVKSYAEHSSDYVDSVYKDRIQYSY